MPARVFLLLLLALAGGFAASEPAQGQGSPKIVYVLPLTEEVGTPMEFEVRRGVKEALAAHADALVLQLDTLGGRTDAMEKIMTIVGKFQPHDKTYAYVDTKAISAGAFISSAARHIYMAPGAVIGAATPVMINSGGGVEDLPKSYQQKIYSAYQAMGRAIAEKNGHNPAVFEAMINPDIGLVVDGKEIQKKGQVLTLTNSEAAALYGKPPKPLLSEGTVPSLEEMVKIAGGENAQTVTFQRNGFEMAGRLIGMVAPFLFMAGIVLGYLEFKMPGFAIFGLLAVLCFGVFFFGQYVAGLSGYGPVLLFLVGVFLVLAEMFLVTGTIIPGVFGVICMVVALLLAMVDSYPNEGLPTMADLKGPVLTLASGITLGLLGVLLLARFMPKRQFFAALEKATTHGPKVDVSEGVAVGSAGVAETNLRPAGTASFGRRRVDVVTEGMMIERGASIVISRVEGMRVVVRPAEQA